MFDWFSQDQPRAVWQVFIFLPVECYITLKFIGIYVSLLLTSLLYRNVTFVIVLIDTLASQWNIPGKRDLLGMLLLGLWRLTRTKLCVNLHLFSSAMANVSEFQLGGRVRQTWLNLNLPVAIYKYIFFSLLPDIPPVT